MTRRYSFTTPRTCYVQSICRIPPLRFRPRRNLFKDARRNMCLALALLVVPRPRGNMFSVSDARLFTAIDTSECGIYRRFIAGYRTNTGGSSFFGCLSISDRYVGDTLLVTSLLPPPDLGGVYDNTSVTAPAVLPFFRRRSSSGRRLTVIMVLFCSSFRAPSFCSLSSAASPPPSLPPSPPPIAAGTRSAKCLTGK